MKVDSENVIKLQGSSTAGSTGFTEATESTANRKMDNVSPSGVLANVDKNNSCVHNAVEDKSERKPNSILCSSFDLAAPNTETKLNGELENRSISSYNKAIFNTEPKSTEKLQNSSNSLFDTSSSSVELNSNLESFESEKEDSIEEIIEITLSDYETDERNVDDNNSYSSSSNEVEKKSPTGVQCCEAGHAKGEKAYLDCEEPEHVSKESKVDDRDQEQIDNNQLTNSGDVNRSSNAEFGGTTHTHKTSNLEQRQECIGTSEEQFPIEKGSELKRVSRSLKQVLNQRQDVSAGNSKVSLRETHQDQPLVDSSGQLDTSTDKDKLEVLGSSGNTGLELGKPCLTTSEIASADPQNSVENNSESGEIIGVVPSELNIEKSPNCERINDLESKQTSEKGNCFINVTASTCEVNKPVPFSKSEQTEVTAANGSQCLSADIKKNSSSDSHSSGEKNISGDLSSSEIHSFPVELNIRLPEKSTCSKAVSAKSLPLNSTEIQSEPLTSNVLTSKVNDKQSDNITVSLPTSTAPEMSSCSQSTSPSSFVLKVTDNPTIPSVSSVTPKPVGMEIKSLAVSLPVSGTTENVSQIVSVSPVTSQIKEKQTKLSSTVSTNSLTQAKSTSSHSVLVSPSVSKTTENLNEPLSKHYPASSMIVKLSGPLLARARAQKVSEDIQSKRNVYSFIEQAADMSKTCSEQSHQLNSLSQFELKTASSGLTDESAHSEVIPASSSTSSCQSRDETSNEYLKSDSISQEPSTRIIDSISDLVKNIKSEPEDDGYEQSSHNSLQNPDLIGQSKIKTEPSTVTDEGKKDASKLKSATKPVTLLPKVPLAIVNRSSSNTNLVCSYLIPINSSVASSTYFQTIVKSVPNAKGMVKKVSLNRQAKPVKSKQQQLRPLCSKQTVVTSAAAAATPVVSDSSTEIPSNPADFRIKSLDISDISQLVQRKNLEKIYKHPAVPLNFKCAQKTYLCTECGDQFLLESSLKDHFQRCSMIIQYYCKSCRVKLLFTNKCSLLKHLRCHTNSSFLTKTPLQISADNISVLSLLDGNMPKTEQPTLCIVNSIEANKLKTLAPKTNKPCPECGHESHLKISHHFGSLGVICNFKHMCKHCCMYLPTACSLRAHYRLHFYIQPFVCPECGMKFDDISTFKRHVNVDCYHFSRVPVFVCPLCSVLVSTASSLEQHFVSEHQNIYFWDRTHFATYEQLLGHEDEAFAEDTRLNQLYFYCQICKSGLQFKFLLNHMHSHMTKLKQNIPFGYICITCKEEYKISKIFISRTSLQKHLYLHKSGQYVRCHECSGIFFSNSELKEHNMRCHNEGENVCKYCSVQVDNMRRHLKNCVAKQVSTMFTRDIVPKSTKQQKALSSKEFLSFLNALNQSGCLPKETVPKSKEEAKPALFVCKYCQRGSFFSLEQLAKHIATHVKDGVLICSKCQRRDFKSFGEMKSHQIVCGLNLTYQDSDDAEEEFGCEECEKYFCDGAALRRHIKEEHAFYPCYLCGLTYSTSADLEQHVNVIHRGRKSVTLSCQLCKGKKGKGKTFMRREFYYNHMATVHGIAKPDDEGSDSKRRMETTGSGSPLKRLKVSEGDHYRCAKCDFSSENAEDFSKHIAKHKKDSSSIQCPNCGLCFRVVPALKGHLLMVHKVKDVDQFIVDKGLQVPEEEEEIDVGFDSFLDPGTFTDSQDNHQDQKRVSDNPKECSVCNRIFETEAEKNFHMRTHGMAFISSRRRQRPKPPQESDDSKVDVINQSNSAPATPDTSSVAHTEDSSQPSPISVAKRVKLSEKSKILQPANQPVVAIERIPTPDQTVGADEESSTEMK